ncbi:MAG: glycosyltransferase, partial [Candidatus Nitrosotenuis sp.]
RGLDILLEAAPEIVRQVPDVRFVFLGSGPENDKLKEIVVQKNLQNHVSFEGWVEREKIPSYLSEGTIGIGPLRSTTVTKNALPIKVLEYMAASLPVIAMENTLPDDVLVDGKNGFVVRDASELAQKIIFLLQNDDGRVKMGKSSLEMVKKFDWTNVANQIVDEYKKCA